jgi:hypothetical protein
MLCVAVPPPLLISSQHMWSLDIFLFSRQGANTYWNVLSGLCVCVIRSLISFSIVLPRLHFIKDDLKDVHRVWLIAEEVYRIAPINYSFELVNYSHCFHQSILLLSEMVYLYIYISLSLCIDIYSYIMVVGVNCTVAVSYIQYIDVRCNWVFIS